MSWLYSSPYLSALSRSGISSYGIGLGLGYDTLYRPYYSYYDNYNYRLGLSSHFYSNPSYRLFGELDRYTDSTIENIELEMNNFLSNISSPNNPYNSYNKPLYYPSLMNNFRLNNYNNNQSALGNFEENRRTPYDQLDSVNAKDFGNNNENNDDNDNFNANAQRRQSQAPPRQQQNNNQGPQPLQQRQNPNQQQQGGGAPRPSQQLQQRSNVNQPQQNNQQGPRPSQQLQQRPNVNQQNNQQQNQPNQQRRNTQQPPQQQQQQQQRPQRNNNRR
jgi:hypothetical protein